MERLVSKALMFEKQFQNTDGIDTVMWVFTELQPCTTFRSVPWARWGMSGTGGRETRPPHPGTKRVLAEGRGT